MGSAQPEETSVSTTESKDQEIEGDAQTTRAELGASLQVLNFLFFPRF